MFVIVIVFLPADAGRKTTLIIYGPKKWGHAKSADVDNVMKGPEADGAVMRNSLVAMLEGGQAKLGISRMALQVQPENWRAPRLYESVGFVPAPRPESPIYGPEAPAGVKNNTERWMTLDMTRLVVSGGPPIFTAAKPH